MTDTAPDDDLESRRRYLPTLLTPRDMARAKKALAEVIGERSAYDMLEDDDERVPFTIWCLESRANPAFTWDDALDTPYLGEWKGGEVGPPQTAAPPAGGARNGAPGSPKRPTEPAPASSSATGTG
ncbi:MAG TPA: hypothetical protein VHM23_25410 [Actinomycetota bacterium]|jgi:hypothetical protein|nr:hypothetical protein [Actinomycetota bacterium]